MALNLNRKKQLDFYLGGVLLTGMKPLAVLLGKLLSRSHSAAPQGTIAVVKLLGGGSLVLATPAFLALKAKYSDRKLVLITTPAVKPFAEVLGFFDEVITLDDRSVMALIRDVVKLCWHWSRRIDTLIDIEVHSRATAILSLLTLARNRWGFFKESAYWRKGLYTHLIFYNTYSPAPVFYGAMMKALGAPPLDPGFASECFRTHVRQNVAPPEDMPGEPYIAVGFSCSDNATERMMPLEQWGRFAASRSNQSTRLLLILGAPSDREKGEELSEALRAQGFRCLNLCGKSNLSQSVRVLLDAEEFWGVDSSLLHLARLLGVNTVSFWGPTDPSTRLITNSKATDRIYRTRTACSPCVHFADIPPCQGQNVCMQNIFSANATALSETTTWLWDEEHQQQLQRIL